MCSVSNSSVLHTSDLESPNPPSPPPPSSMLGSDTGCDCDARADGRLLSAMSTSAPTPSPSSNTTATTNATDPTPLQLWLGLIATVGCVAGAVVLLLLRRRRRWSFARRSIYGVDGLDQSLMDEAHSDHMWPTDENIAQGSDGSRMAPVPSAVTIPRDAQEPDGIRMTPVPATATVPRYARDLDGISSSSLQLLLMESAAPAFIGEGSSLVPDPTCTNIHAHACHSELEPRGGHVEQ